MSCDNCEYKGHQLNNQSVILCRYSDIHFIPGSIQCFKDQENKNNNRKWRKFSDGWFTYYINVTTGEKKLNLEEGDIEIQ